MSNTRTPCVMFLSAVAARSMVVLWNAGANVSSGVLHVSTLLHGQNSFYSLSCFVFFVLVFYFCLY